MSNSQFGKEKYLPNYQTESMSIVTNIKCYTRVCQYGVYTLVCTTTALSSKHVFHFFVCVSPFLVVLFPKFTYSKVYFRKKTCICYA